MFPIVLATVLVAIMVIPSLAAPELRWIAYVKESPSFGSVSQGVMAIRSDGRARRSVMRESIRSVDLGSAGLLYAVLFSYGTFSETTSVVIGRVGDSSSQPFYEAEPEFFYYGVSASSDGRVAVARHFTGPKETPRFLSEGLDALRSTKVPVLVPREEPQGTGGLVPSVEEHSYQLLFTNDPAGELAHVEQVNVFVSGTAGEPERISDAQAQRVTVRGTEGEFFCGASTCFLTWNELDTNYTVGEFGSNEQAIAFAESLVPLETVMGPGWREGKYTPTPELIVRERDGRERVLESVTRFCECSFGPLDWNTENDRLLVLESVEGHTTLQEYRFYDSGEPSGLAEGVATPDGLGLIVDAAYGPDGIVGLFSGDGGPPGILRPLDGGDPIASDVRAFDIEGSTLAYVNESGDVIVRDLSTGKERTVGEGAIDVSVAPDLIPSGAGEGAGEVQLQIDDEGLSGLQLVAIVLAGLAVLGGGALWLFVARRRCLD